MKKIFLAIMGMGLMVACGSKNEVPERDVLVDSIEVMEQGLMNASVNTDLEKANQMIALYDLFANNYPDDSLVLP